MTTHHAPPEARRRPPPGKLSFEAFLDWLDEDTWAEWVRGEVQMVSPASRRHQDLAGFLYKVLSEWAAARGLGVVLSAPFLMRLPPPVDQAREPDLLFVARAHLDRLRETYLDGPADLVVEILSLESVGRDRGEKFVEYERGGIAEYWLVDPDRQQAEFYQLDTDGRYRLVLGGATGLYESRVLAGLRLPLEWLWQEPLPTAIQALRALGLLD